MLAAGVADTMEAMTASLLYLLLRQVLQMLTQPINREGVQPQPLQRRQTRHHGEIGQLAHRAEREVPEGGNRGEPLSGLERAESQRQ